VSERPVLRVPAFLDPLCGAVGVAVFAGLVYAGFAGSQSAQSNVLPTFVYVLFWVGVPIVSALCGDGPHGDARRRGLVVGRLRRLHVLATATCPPINPRGVARVFRRGIGPVLLASTAEGHSSAEVRSDV